MSPQCSLVNSHLAVLLASRPLAAVRLHLCLPTVAAERMGSRVLDGLGGRLRARASLP